MEITVLLEVTGEITTLDYWNSI